MDRDELDPLEAPEDHDADDLEKPKHEDGSESLEDLAEVELEEDEVEEDEFSDDYE